jgi:hypothetical protein
LPFAAFMTAVKPYRVHSLGLSARPKSLDLEPGLAVRNPSAASPRLNNSRTAAARLGMRFLNRKSSTKVNSSAESLIGGNANKTTFSDVFLAITTLLI